MLKVESSDASVASPATLQLQNSYTAGMAEMGTCTQDDNNEAVATPMQSCISAEGHTWHPAYNLQGFTVSATAGGDFQIATGEGNPLLTIDRVTYATSLAGSLRVESGGVNITGGLEIATAGLGSCTNTSSGTPTSQLTQSSCQNEGHTWTPGLGLRVQQGGAVVTGGMTLVDVGLLVEQGGMTIAQGGAVVTGGIVVETAGLRVKQGGIVVENGGMNVSEDGMVVEQGGVVVQPVERNHQRALLLLLATSHN